MKSNREPQPEATDVEKVRRQVERVASLMEHPAIADQLAPRRKALFGILAHLTQSKLRVGVLGVTSSGKSTFVNALVGESILPEQSKPTSNVLVSVRKGPSRAIEVLFKDGRKERFVGKDFAPHTVDRYCSEERNPRNEQGVQGVALETPDALLTDNLELVDTPGLDAYGYAMHEELTLREFVPTADIIIYLTSIRNPLKRADIEALGHVIENDQRVLFVITGKNLERDDTELGRVIKTRAAKLDEHVQRLERDIALQAGLWTAGVALVDSKEAIAARCDRDDARWRSSGMDWVAATLERFGRDVSRMALESRMARAAHHVKEAQAQIAAELARARGDRAGWQRQIDARCNALKQLKTVLAVINSRLDGLAVRIDADQALAPLHAARLTNSSEAWEFSNVTAACDGVLQQEFTRVRNEIDGMRAEFQALLQSVGLNAPRVAVPDADLSSLPPAQPREYLVNEPIKRKMSWGVRLRFWPHTEVKDHYVTRRDAAEFGNSMASRMNWGLQRLDQLVQSSIEVFRSRFATPVSQECARVAEEIGKTEAAANDATAPEHVLAKLDRELKELDRLLERQAPAPVARSRSVYAESIVTPAPPMSLPARALLPLLDTFRELAFHRCVESILSEFEAQSGENWRVAVVGLHAEDRWRFAHLLLHRMARPINARHGADPRSPQPTGDAPAAGGQVDDPVRVEPADDSAGTARPNWMSAVRVRSCRALKDIDLVVGPDDESPFWRRHGRNFLAWTDVVVMLVDGPRIGSALSDLERAPYYEPLAGMRNKVVYAIPHGAKFDDKLEHLVTEVAPSLKRYTRTGDRPLLVYENYDVRYTHWLNIMHAARPPSAEALLRLWRVRKLPISPPFTVRELSLAYDRVVGKDGMGASSG